MKEKDVQTVEYGKGEGNFKRETRLCERARADRNDEKRFLNGTE